MPAALSRAGARNFWIQGSVLPLRVSFSGLPLRDSMQARELPHTLFLSGRNLLRRMAFAGAGQGRRRDLWGTDG
eukprot:532049-Rhodomonas_salina.1